MHKSFKSFPYHQVLPHLFVHCPVPKPTKPCPEARGLHRCYGNTEREEWFKKHFELGPSHFPVRALLPYHPLPPPRPALAILIWLSTLSTRSIVAMWPQANSTTSLRLSFLACKMGIKRPTTCQGDCGNKNELTSVGTLGTLKSARARLSSPSSASRLSCSV